MLHLIGIWWMYLTGTSFFIVHCLLVLYHSIQASWSTHQWFAWQLAPYSLLYCHSWTAFLNPRKGEGAGVCMLAYSIATCGKCCCHIAAEGHSARIYIYIPLHTIGYKMFSLSPGKCCDSDICDLSQWYILCLCGLLFHPNRCTTSLRCPVA